MGGIETSLNEILSLRLCDERLELGGGESVNQSGFGDYEQKHLSSSQRRKFISLSRKKKSERFGSLPVCVCVCGHTFFIIPALRLEKVMCLLDLS